MNAHLRNAMACLALGAASACAHAPPAPPPSRPQPATTPDAPFRARQPAPQGALHFTPPTPVTLKLEDGLTVYLVEQHALPLVSVELVIRSGRDADPIDEQGLAAFTADMLDEGTRDMAAPQIAASFEDLAIDFEAGTSQSATRAGFSTLSNHLDRALQLFGDVVLHPRFGPKDVERVRGERLAALTATHDDPSAVAQDVMMRALYGPKNPLGAPAEGTAEGIEAIRPSDLRRFHAAHYVPSNAALVVVGDVTPAALLPMLEARLLPWPDHPVRARAPAPVPAAAVRQIRFVNKPDAPQSQIWLGQLTLDATSTDRCAFVIMNDIFGGLFSSRVNLALREGTGWSYGVSSFPNWNSTRSAWLVTGGFVANKTGAALAKLSELIAVLHQGRVSPAELAAARDAEIRSLASTFEGNGSTANELAALVALGLPVDYDASLQKRFEAVTTDDVERVARTDLSPDHLAIVVVGPAAERAQVAALKLGPVLQTDDAGTPVP